MGRASVGHQGGAGSEVGCTVTLPPLDLPDRLYSAIWAARRGRPIPVVIVEALEARFLGKKSVSKGPVVQDRPLFSYVEVVE